VGAVGSYTFTGVTANHTISASFAIDVFTITASAGANGAISPTGAVSVNYGTDTTFTITPSTGYHILDVLVDGSSVGAVGSYTFTGVTANHTIAALFAINNYIVTASGWNMISLPVEPDSCRVGYLFPGYQAAFDFLGGTYHLAICMDHCNGYWLKMPANDSVEVRGGDVSNCSITLVSGWNLIGVPNCSVTPVTDPPGNITAIFEYLPSSGYRLVSNGGPLIPDKAYWVRSSSTCNLILDCNPVLLSNEKGDVKSEKVSSLSEFSLHAQGEELGGVSDYEVVLGTNSFIQEIPAPPAPPEYSVKLELNNTDWSGPFCRDIRMDGGDSCSWVIALNPHGNISPPSARTAILSWAPSSLEEEGEYFLVDGYDGTGQVVVPDMRAVNEYSLTGINRDYYFTLVHIANPTGISGRDNAIPKEYSLYQAYPNPFNPQTTIAYDLPKDSFVKLIVFDLLGRAVRMLSNGNQAAGHKQVIWDGKTETGVQVTSGIYFYSLTTSEYSKTMKMTVIR
jgi:hypothetical protein